MKQLAKRKYDPRVDALIADVMQQDQLAGGSFQP